MPGYGTFPAPFASTALNYRQAARSSQSHVEEALAIGYRHLDTAFTYQNQDLVGAAIKARGIPRQEIFVTSKLHPNNNDYHAASSKIREAIQLIWGKDASESDHYLDAFLLHYPGLRNPIEAWKALIDARKQGLVRHAGVSNFEIGTWKNCARQPANTPPSIKLNFIPTFMLSKRSCWNFAGGGTLRLKVTRHWLKDRYWRIRALQTIAVEHGTSPARIVLRWCMQHGVRPIVGTRNRAHMQMNAEPYTFSLSDNQMLLIDSLGNTKTVRVSLKWDWNPKKRAAGRLGFQQFPAPVPASHSAGNQGSDQNNVARPPAGSILKNSLMRTAGQD